MPAKKAKKPSAKKPSRLRRAAGQVAVDADQVREDLNRLLLSLENLSVEALREVSDSTGADCGEDRRRKAIVDRRCHRWRCEHRENCTSGGRAAGLTVNYSATLKPSQTYLRFPA
jgi:hypothetical protein